MLLKNFLFNNLSQGLQFGTRWFLSLTLIVVLGVDDFATFSFVYSASNIMLAVFPFGSSVFLISDTNNESKKIEILLDSLFVVVLIFITFLIFYILTFSFVEDVKGWNYIGFSLFLSLFLAINFLLFSYFKSLGDFKKELTAYLVFAGLLLLFIAYLIFFPRGEQMISLILSLLIGINMIVTIIGFTYLAKSNSYTFEGVRAPSLKKIIIIFNERRYFGLQEIVTAIYTQSGMLILFYLLDDIVYGYYRALYVIVAPAFMITVALSQVVLSQFKIYKGLILISNFRKTQKYTIVFGFLLTAFFYLFKPFIFNFLNLDSNSSFNIAYLFILAIILIRFFFVNYEMFLVVVNKQKQRFLVMLVSALFSILLMFLLLPKYGLIGALVINTISYAIVLIGTSFIAEKKIKLILKK
ncbi:polysaccharide biosynthesis protein [Cellulophaga lytica DSM 7489]|uniref:Polysaccharide biosynthesis protein n=1 Tax=Cellulophaga lytica (strain ATCC 23178 / DSM 7489 / JCM 8516 / NBRC 14961 / NCIMB 1423 / VKM B-1433 / Cy l20) TaxID=867900 RepID=F0RHE3_CELLC|nr:lipopolysaccharide biosynthesis protein [Cellulophaga lytica]ADY29183.1 polysaccharide biosynthesis protein [Cellulophaga lytica DSM 7489]WQG76643.1 lipopolysaccharide biosynthesis protein [Cellulophaga lytica]